MSCVLNILVAQQICPMCTGIVPHVGGPVTGPGAETVLTSLGPVSKVGDLCVCVGPPSTVVTGAPTVLVEGTPVAVEGISITDHGGEIAGPPTPNVLAG